ncbi:3-deoxy-7-phosphoheptulonate synthase [Gemmatimonadetes bacterium T265]|nr:3-deoxy-7-phosphoheptulonate synthase [Gemmatimonadetes bacterium T265]
MLVVMQSDATPAQIDDVCEAIRAMGFEPRPMPGAQRTAVGLVGNDGQVDGSHISGMGGVAQVLYVSKPYKQVSREWKPESSVIEIAPGVRFGAGEVPVIAGPCSVENERQIIASAQAVRDAGAVALRGGAFKPRSSPYSFQGLGLEGLRLLAKAREETGLAIVTEALDEEGARLVVEYADVVQIGARNMQNFSLLRTIGRLGKPVLLKRGMAATIQELLLAAEYVLAAGNPNVILCERGVRGFDPATRNIFDVSAVPLVHKLSHLPVVADPSHGVGVREYVPAMARAAVAAGADGLIIEVHPTPDRALSDGAQSLYPEQFAKLMREVDAIARAIGRELAAPAVAAGAR